MSLCVCVCVGVSVCVSVGGVEMYHSDLFRLWQHIADVCSANQEKRHIKEVTGRDEF